MWADMSFKLPLKSFSLVACEAENDFSDLGYFAKLRSATKALISIHKALTNTSKALSRHYKH